jgi:HEAT repeat protein
MGIFDGFRTGQAISKVLSARPGSAESAKAAERVLSCGRGAIPKLIEALAQDHSGTLAGLLAKLVSNTTLPDIVKLGLLSEDQAISNAVRRALLDAPQLDPNRLLELYVGKGGAVASITDLLLARKQAINAKSALRLLELAREDEQPVLFKVIDQIAAASMVPTLIGFLKSAEWEGRYYIAQTLSRFPGEGTRDALVRLLSDPNKKVRQAALDGIAALGMSAPADKICALLRDTDMIVQARAIEAAIKLNDPGSVRHLLEILQDDSEHARRAAVEVLNAIGNPNAIKDLLFALKDKDWWVRSRAADALGAIGGPKVIDAVLQLLGDTDEFMRRTAVEILNTTKDERAFDYLVKSLADPDWWVRERAIDALANLGDKRAVAPLIGLLGEDNQATGVAIRALGQLGDPAAIAPLLGKLSSRDEMVQRETVEALGVLATATEADAIAQALGAVDALTPEIRDVALRLASEVLTRFLRKATPRRAAPGMTSAPAAANTTNSSPAAAAASPAASIDASATTLDEGPVGAGSGSNPANAARRATAAAHAAASGEQIGDLASIQPGQVLGGRYKIIRELGCGGFGTVLRVEDQMVGEEIALKLINPQLVQDESATSRFIHEVRYARRVAHENVIRVYDFLMVGGFYAISMEYFPSHPLARRIRHGIHRRPAEGLKFIRDVARGMQVAHQADIVHRDLKPANILVNDADVLKIVDFGLAAACSHADSRVTKTGHLVGTPTYMSPEQARGLAIDARTDIYSLGVIMYEVFTGLAPYAAENPLSVLYQHLEGAKEAPSRKNPAISPKLEATILKAMALKPEDRYQSAQALLDDLAALELRNAA